MTPDTQHALPCEGELRAIVERLFVATMVEISTPVDVTKIEDPDCEWQEESVCGECIRAMDDHAPDCEIGKLAAEYVALATRPSDPVPPEPPMDLSGGVLRDVMDAVWTLPKFAHHEGNSLAQDVRDYAASVAVPPEPRDTWPNGQERIRVECIGCGDVHELKQDVEGHWRIRATSTLSVPSDNSGPAVVDVLRAAFTRPELTLLDADLQGAASHYRDKVKRFEDDTLVKIDNDGLRKRKDRAGRLERLRAVVNASNPRRKRIDARATTEGAGTEGGTEP